MAQTSKATSTIFWSLTALGVGGLLFYYGRKRKGTLIGRMTTAAGMSLLLKAIRNPLLTEHLGPLAGLLEGPLAQAQKLLA
jgi:hypothetical protein